MTRPTDRTCEIQPLGDIDHGAGEFWATNPFAIVKNGENLSAYERNKFYLNVDGEQFFDASFASGADIDSDSRSVVSADFDNDGDPDLLVGSTGGGALRLFENQFPSENQFLKIKLRGTQSNRAAIGSRVILESGSRKIIRDLFPRNGCMGLGPADLVVGVGKATTLDRVTVRWPSGKTKTVTGVSVKVPLEIKED
ncbi:MAG: CRTAC1 family protein [Planctomycetota bacterium]|nr:CRTAC1 family protein [Planctomycetota bacterium]